ncbi:hypothetical protein [Bifidobacterium parmae]|uniref:Uncharacterized protein n=1 Tax=Bifidobacterium parmae TaxID=361854 RepID=A0A2N5IW44_9BIFI|nr:hypothetical protein [Bifidobacterium parmae]PLS26184.1 hypothetical protein Uis4E_2096 [Bifidobacterium parmae]
MKVRFLIADVALAVIVAIIILLLPHTDTASFWLAFACTLLGVLAFLVPALLPPPRDHMSRVPLYVALSGDLVVQVVLLVVSNFVGWKVVAVTELVMLIVLGGIGFMVSARETQEAADATPTRPAYDPRPGAQGWGDAR